MKKYLLCATLFLFHTLSAACSKYPKIKTFSQTDGIPAGWTVHYKLLNGNKISYTIRQTHKNNITQAIEPDSFSITVIDYLENRSPKDIVLSVIKKIQKCNTF